MPTKEELPKAVNIEASEYTAILYWQKPKCEYIYGPLLYLIKLSSKQANYYRELESGDPNFKFADLQPYTNYNAEIVVARSRDALKNDGLTLKTFYNFTTTPTGSQNCFQIFLFVMFVNFSCASSSKPRSLLH